MNDTYERLYTEQQLADAISDGVDTYNEYGEGAAIATGTRKQFAPGVQKHIDGALGEIVFAEHFNLPFNRIDWTIGDVGIYQIKSTRCPNDEINLIVPRNQAITYKASPFVLVQLFDCHYKIRGWTWGHQIPTKTHWLQDNADTSGGAYWVTTERLEPIEDLPIV
jgi:hypothetical protein